MKYNFTLIILFFAQLSFAQDSLNMSLLYRFDPDTIPTNGSREFNECWGYATCSGEEIAILGSSARVHFFDVTDPANAYEIAWFDGGDITTWRDMKSYKNHLYSVCDACTEGLMIFDLSNTPDTVVLTNQTNEFWGRCHNVFVDVATGRLYGAGTNTVNNGLVVLDIESDPNNPVKLADIPLPGGYVHDLFVHDNLLFANHANNGIYVYNFEDPQNPELLGLMSDYPESGYNHSCWLDIDGNTLVMCDETFDRGVKTVNVENLEDIFVEQVFRSVLEENSDSASIAHNPLIRDNLAFISYYHDGVQVYDISQPDSVFRVAYYDTEPGNTDYNGFTGCWGVYPYLPSGNILASDMTRGLFVLSADSLINGASIGGVDLNLNPTIELAASGDLSICEGDSVILTATGEGITQWIDITTNTPLNITDTLTLFEEGSYGAVLSLDICSIQSDTVFEIEVTSFPLTNITPQDSVIACEGEFVLLEVEEGAESYIWTKDSTALLDTNNNSYEASITGNYFVTATNGNCQTVSDNVYVEFTPDTPFNIIVDGQTFTAGIEGVSFQWFLDGEPIPDGTTQSIQQVGPGEYFVVVTDENGCTRTSTITLVFNSTEDALQAFNLYFELSPVPADDILYLSSNQTFDQLVTFSIINMLGQVVWSHQQEQLFESEINFDISSLASGTYLFQIETDGKNYLKKIIKK